MAVFAPSPHTNVLRHEAQRLTRRTWILVPVGLAVWVVIGMVTYASLGLFGLDEGALILMAHSVAAWAFDLATWAIIALAPVLGVTFGVKAIRRGGGGAAWAGLVVNGLFIVTVAYQVFDEIRMSYFPSFTWPFG